VFEVGGGGLEALGREDEDRAGEFVVYRKREACSESRAGRRRRTGLKIGHVSKKRYITIKDG